jgi:Methyltransferase domain
MLFSTHAIGRALPDFFLDRVDVDRCGLIRLVGWSARKFRSDMIPRVFLEDEIIPFLQYYRVTRPDAAQGVKGLEVEELGLVLEYQVPEQIAERRFAHLSITVDGSLDRKVKGPFQFWHAPYAALLNSSDVFHRQHIYGSGPPNMVVNPETLALAERLPGPLLDFGCGSGVLVAQLIAAGKEAKGIELDIEVISRSIDPAVRSSIVLYDGRFPAPFPDASFRSVFCSEVLEHIPNYQEAIAEIARLATEAVTFTVPDASAIPIGSAHGLVPWHLLESTHVNFFNQSSLNESLRLHFREIEFGRVGLSSMNGSPYYLSLVAYCRK